MATRFLYLYLKDSDCYKFFEHYISDFNRKRVQLTQEDGVTVPKIELVPTYRDEMSELIEKKEKIISVGNTIPENFMDFVPKTLYEIDGMQIKKYTPNFLHLSVDERIAHNKEGYFNLLMLIGQKQKNSGIGPERQIAKVTYTAQGLQINGWTEKRILGRGIGQKAFMYGIVPFGFVIDGSLVKSDDLYARNQAIKYGLYVIENNYFLDFMDIKLPTIII